MDNNISMPKLDRLYGMEQMIAFIDENLRSDSGGCVLLKGPQGSGKTTLLNTMLSYEYRCNMAREHRVLITEPKHFPLSLTYDQIFGYFIDMINIAATMLPAAGYADVFQNIALCNMQSSMYNTMDGKLAYLISTLRNVHKFSVVIVLDGFEKFTSSQVVRREHHDILNRLVDENHLRIIAATDYDLSDESLTVEGTGSKLLQKFGPCSKDMPRLSISDAMEYAEKLCQHWQVEYVEGKAKLAYAFSGGIPAVLETSLQSVFMYGSDNNEEMLKHCKAEICEKCSHLMEKWCDCLEDKHLDYLHNLFDENSPYNYVSDSGSNILGTLESRGLILHNGNKYDYNSYIFRMFCEKNSFAQRRESDELLQFNALMNDIRSGIMDDLVGRTEGLTVEHKALVQEELDRIARDNDIEGEVTELEYRQLGITMAQMQQLPEHTRISVDQAIQNGRCMKLLSEGEHLNRDHSHVIFSFARAYECHIKESLYPLMLFIHRNTSLDIFHCSGFKGVWDSRSNSYAEDAYGNRIFPIDGYEVIKFECFENFMRNAAHWLGEKCEESGDESLKGCDEQWWIDYADDVLKVRKPRNKIFHKEESYYQEARNLLNVMYTSDRGMVGIMKARRLYNFLNARLHSGEAVML